MVAIGGRELLTSQAEFRAAANKLAPGKDPQATWLAVREDHPPLGGVVAATRKIVDSLTAFVVSHGIASVPPGERVVVAAGAALRPRLRVDARVATARAQAREERLLYNRCARGSRPQQQEAWLERYNYASLSNTAAHEAMPGHWLHSTYMRRTPGKIRRIWIGLNPFPQPSSGQDGWAHYAEQMVLDEGYRRRRSASSSRAAERRADEDLPIPVRHQGAHQAVDARRRATVLREGGVRRGARGEARSGARDVRSDVRRVFPRQARHPQVARRLPRACGKRVNLRSFHERFMTNGIAPIWAQRQLLLPGDKGAIID